MPIKSSHLLIICKFRFCILTESIKKHFEKKGVPFRVVYRPRLKARDIKNKQLVIVTGGDGTFLQASHFIKDQTPLMGINPKPHASYGFFAAKNHVNYLQKIEHVLEGKKKPKVLHRLRVVIGKREVPFRVLNEIFYANKNPAQVNYYKINGEMQMSSGVIVSTAAGSTAWSQSAGGTVLPIEAKKFQYVVREPFKNKYPQSKNYKKIFGSRQSVNIENLMDDSRIAIDGAEVSYSLKKGQTLTVRLAKESLHAIL